MGKVKVKTAVTDYEGVTLKENQAIITPSLISEIKKHGLSQAQVVDILETEVKKENLTYRILIHQALNSLTTTDKPDGTKTPEILSSTDKAKCYEITQKTFATNEPDYTSDQITFILERAEKIFQFPLYIGKLKDFLLKK